MRSHVTVVTAMFAICVGIGLCADEVWQSAVGWFAIGSGSARLHLGVESRSHGVRIENMTGDRWSNCVVTLDGGYRSPPIALGPGRRRTIPYVLFGRDEEMLQDTDGIGRAFRSTAVKCADTARQQSFAIVR